VLSRLLVWCAPPLGVGFSMPDHAAPSRGRRDDSARVPGGRRAAAEGTYPHPGDERVPGAYRAASSRSRPCPTRGRPTRPAPWSMTTPLSGGGSASWLAFGAGAKLYRFRCLDRSGFEQRACARAWSTGDAVCWWGRHRRRRSRPSGVGGNVVRVHLWAVRCRGRHHPSRRSSGAFYQLRCYSHAPIPTMA